MSSPENDLGNLEDKVGDGDAPRWLSSREWLYRDREQGPREPGSSLRPVPSSWRFTWGVRAGIVLAALFFGGLVVWSRLDAARGWSTLLAVLTGVAVLVASVGLVEAWCWAGRPRLSTSPVEPITAGLGLEAKKTVKRMARGSGPDVPELRTRAAIYAWAQQQGSGLGLPFLSLVNLVNLGNLAQNPGSTFAFVVGVVFLPISVGLLGWALWLGHRARALAVHLPNGPAGPPASHVDGGSR